MPGNPHLIAHLQQLIRDCGPLAFSEYMDRVLYHPEYGYYVQAQNPIGPEGDFYTAANVDPAMGTLLAKLFARMAVGIEDFCLVEIGAGTGLLARHILESDGFPSAIAYIIVEKSAAMRARQQEMLAGFEVSWHEVLPSSIRGCVFSNEFFDALPVRRFVRREGTLRELFVSEGFVEVEGEPEIPLELPLLQEGCRADLSLDASAWIDRIGRSIESGYHLAIDYGYLNDEFFARREGTLMCYRRHRAEENPYVAIGEQDITAHVNFSDLIERGTEAGLERVGYRSQMEFLIGLGLLELMEPLTARGDAASVRRVQALKNLLLPPMMGERFKVLLQRKGLRPTDLPGFAKTVS